MRPHASFEEFIYAGASVIPDRAVVFVGFHWPMVMARVARRLFSPDLVAVYECGVVEDRLTPRLPTSPSDLHSAVGSPVCAGSVDALYMWLGSGRVDMTLLEAPIVDRFGNVNSTVVGTYQRPTVRLAGSGGGTELAALGNGLVLVNGHTDARHYPGSVDYVTSPGYLTGRRDRDRFYRPGTGPTMLLTPFGKYRYGADGSAYLAGRYADTDDRLVARATQWEPAVAARVEAIPRPTEAELAVVREELRAARRQHYVVPAEGGPPRQGHGAGSTDR